MAVRIGSIFIFLSIAIATAREITNQFQDGQTLQCPDGWRQNRDRCLYFSQDHGEYVKTWNEARDICMLYTLPLVSIRDSKDRDQIYGKVEKILKGSLDPIPSPSVKIQIMCGKVCLRCKGKTLLGVVNKLLKTKKNVDITQQCFAL